VLPLAWVFDAHTQRPGPLLRGGVSPRSAHVGYAVAWRAVARDSGGRMYGDGELESDWPTFTDDPVDRLRHVLAVFGPHVDPDSWAIQATSNALPGFPETGITWGDLDTISNLL
jgi:hypothetical protein